MVGPPSRDSTPWANARAPGCTAPTGWGPTPSWKPLSLVGEPAEAVEGECETSAAPLRRLVHTPMAEQAPAVRVNVTDVLYAMKSLMWRAVGVRRIEQDMAEARDQLAFWASATQRLAPNTIAAWELMNMLTVARLASFCALARTESRGAHFRHDHPAVDPAWRVHSTIRTAFGPPGLLGEPTLDHQGVDSCTSSVSRSTCLATSTTSTTSSHR